MIEHELRDQRRLAEAPKRDDESNAFHFLVAEQPSKGLAGACHATLDRLERALRFNFVDERSKQSQFLAAPHEAIGGWRAVPAAGCPDQDAKRFQELSALEQ